MKKRRVKNNERKERKRNRKINDEKG